MTISREMGIQLLMDIIKNKIRHPNYERTVSLADRYTKIITGEGMDSMMHQFSPRESEEMFKQRCRITKHITSTVARNLIKPQYKVPRANNIQRILKYKDDNGQEQASTLESILRKFYGDLSLDWWMNNRWIDLQNIDPNAFVVVEFKPFDANKEKASPYPFEASSKEVIDYRYENNILQYLCVLLSTKEKLPEKDRTVTTQMEKYTLYLPDRDIIMTSTKNREVRKFALEDGKIVEALVNDISVQALKIGKEYYILEEPTPHKLNFVRAVMVGYYRDLYTKGVTRLSAIDDAMPILEKMIKANSELDLTMALHAFPQKIQSVRKCQNENCNHGELPDGQECPTCKGSGLAVHKTAQDIILLPLPRNREEMLDIDNVIRYISPPVELVKFQDEYIKSLTRQCKEAIYNTQLFSREEIAQTATGKNIDLQNVYDALYPLALGYSYSWKFFVEASARIVDMFKGLIAEFIFNKDFKMKSLNDLYADLKVLYDSGADDFVKQEVTNDIARIIYADDPISFYRYQTKRNFYPFEGKNPQQIAALLASNLVSEKTKILWANYGFIFDEIFQEQAKDGKDFFVLNKEAQAKLIWAKVDEIQKSLPKPTPPTPLNPQKPDNGNQPAQ